MPGLTRQTDPRLKTIVNAPAESTVVPPVAPPVAPPAPPLPAHAPSIRALTLRECEEVLHRNTVGRLAFSIDGHVDVQPLHFVYEDGWIYGRTAFGAKITALRHSHWVAFEVDETDAVFDWRSVVVRGGLYFLEPDGTRAEQEDRRLALGLLSRIVPATGTAADPVPVRTIVFRIHAAEITGRVATPASF